MLLTERKIRHIVRKILKEDIENSTKNKWDKASSFEITDAGAEKLKEHEALVPYVYSDGDTMHKSEFVKKVKNYILEKLKKGQDYKASYNEIEEQIKSKDPGVVEKAKADLKIFKKEYNDLAEEYTKEIVESSKINNIIVNMWPKNKLPKPAFSYEDVGAIPTIGVGHAILLPKENKDERDKFKDYLFSSMIDKFLDDKKANSPVEIPFDSFLMSEEASSALYKEDLITHSQWATDERVTKPITQSMFDALTSFAFNAGWQEKKPIDNIIKLINKGQYSSAEEKIKTTAISSRNEAGETVVNAGIQSRRQKEAALFSKDGLKPPA